MANHPNRGWRRRWTVDLTAGTATHESGMVVKFVQAGEGEWDGRATTIPESMSADPKRASRLMSEAADIYQEARDGLH